MKAHLKYTIIPILGMLLISSLPIFGQTGTAYYMGTLPQSYYLNPATQPGCDLFLGMPVGSQVYFRGTTSGISGDDIFFKDPQSDSVITPLHPNGDVDAFLNNLNKIETFGFQSGFNLASFGFRVKELYFAFDASVRFSEEVTVSKDFLSFLLKGNANNQSFDFSDVGVEALQYTELGLNVSYNFSDQLQVGIRPKLLYGLATLSTLNNNTTLSTSVDAWELNADYQARFAATGVTVPVDEDGNFDPDGEFEYDSTVFSPTGYRNMFSKNRGLGIDLGAHYKPIDELQVSLSILDLGYIKWRESTHVAKLNGSYTFRGINATPLADTIEAGEEILDSLESSLNITSTDEAFRSRLNPKIFVGARYFITPAFDVGILSRTEFFKTYIDQDIMLLANWHPIPMISVSGSYNILGKSYSTFGLGLGLKLLPFNFYLILEDIPFRYDNVAMEDGPSIFMPVNQDDFNIRFGFNLVFGCNKMKKLKKDKPMYNSSDWIL